MSMLSHTKVIRLLDEDYDIQSSQFDPFAEALIDLEIIHPELLDSSGFADRGKQTLGADITIEYTGSYVEAVAHADSLITEALETAGVRYSGEQVVDEDGPRSLALS